MMPLRFLSCEAPPLPQFSTGVARVNIANREALHEIMGTALNLKPQTDFR